MIEDKGLEEVLAIALSRGGDFADIFIEEKVTTGIVCESSRIERVNTGIDIGAGVRVIKGDTTSYAYTNDVSLKGLSEIAKAVSFIAEGEEQSVAIDLRHETAKTPISIGIRPDQVNIDEKVERVLQADKVARSSADLKQVSVSYGDIVQKVTIANSEGILVKDERVRNRFAVNAIAADQNGIQTGFQAIGSAAGFETLNKVIVSDVGREAARRATLMLSAKPAPAGKMPVVMAGEAGGTMVHEACGHGLEADLVQKGLSVYGSKRGQQVASSLITVIDDATILNKYGSYNFDDEGVAARECILIKDGILEDYLYDKNSAIKEKRASNGHGRRESYQHKPIPRMANTYIASGKENPEKIIGDIKEGLLVKKMGGGQVNTTTGDFVFDVAEGYMIKEGKVAYPVRGATLTGNGPQILKNVDRVGKDLGFTIGTCGKDGQGAPVSDAQPTMSIPEIIVGGTALGDSEPAKSCKIRRI